MSQYYDLARKTDKYDTTSRLRRKTTLRAPIGCDECGAYPLTGSWRCRECDDFDLCENCHGRGVADAAHFNGNHTFRHIGNTCSSVTSGKRGSNMCSGPQGSANGPLSAASGPAPCAAPRQQARLNQAVFVSERWAWSDVDKRTELSDPECRILVIRDARTRAPVAFAAFKLLVEEGVTKATEVLYVYELQLVSNIRGRGLGRLLMMLLERIASEAGVKMIMLTVFRANVKALEFYTRKCGFSVDECSPSRCFSVNDSPYEILSKCLQECVDALLIHKCPHCPARYRYALFVLLWWW